MRELLIGVAALAGLSFYVAAGVGVRPDAGANFARLRACERAMNYGGLIVGAASSQRVDDCAAEAARRESKSALVQVAAAVFPETR